MQGWKRLLLGITIIVLVYAVLPMTAIDILKNFALGWMIMDIVNHFTSKW